MSLEASAQMPSDCKDCLIHAKRLIEESGLQSKGVSPHKGLVTEMGSYGEELIGILTDRTGWGTKLAFATKA